MSLSIPQPQAAYDAVASQANALIDGLQRVGKSPQSPQKPIVDSAFDSFAQQLVSHTSATGEVKAGDLQTEDDPRPALQEYRSSKSLGLVDSVFPGTVGLGEREQQIRSGEVLISLSRPGTDDLEKVRIPIATAADAAELDQSLVDSGAGPATTLTQLAQKIDSIEGLSAAVEDGKLNVTSNDGATKFAISDTGTGLLAQLGGEHVAARDAFDRFVGTTVYGQMLSAMRKGTGEPAYFYGGKAEEMFRKQLDTVLADKLTEATSGQFSEGLYRAQFNAYG